MIYRRMFGVPAWGFRSPFAELERMRHQMDQLAEGFGREGIRLQSAGVFPMINLTEDRDNYYVHAELPGVEGSGLNIEAETNTLSLSGERTIAAEGDSIKYHRREREAGKFSRIISLPGEIDPDKVEASLANGLLKVVVPKAEAVKPRQIEVK